MSNEKAPSNVTDVELAALTALVNHEAAEVAAHVAQYGQQMCAPSHAPATLHAILVARGVLR